MTHLWAVFAVFDESQWGAVDISGFALTTESVLYFGTKALHLVAFQITANSPPQLPKRFIWSAADDGALSEAAVAASQAKDKAVLFDCLLIFQIKKKEKHIQTLWRKTVKKGHEGRWIHERHITDSNIVCVKGKPAGKTGSSSFRLERFHQASGKQLMNAPSMNTENIHFV